MRTIAVTVVVVSTSLFGAETPGWRVPFSPVNAPSVSDVIALGDDLIYGGGNDGALVAVSTANGDQRWRFQIGTPEAASNIVIAGRRDIFDAIARRIILEPPAWHSPLVYVASRHSKPKDLPNVYALDGVSGKPRWSFFTPGGAYGPPIAAGDRVIVTGRRLVHALDSATGAERWSFEPLKGLHDEARRPPSAVVVDQGAVYFTAWPFHQFRAPHHSYLFALDAVTGERRWKVDVAGNDVTVPVLQGDTVHFGVEEEDGQTASIYAVNRATGAIRWKTAVESARTVQTLVARDDALYVGADGTSSSGQRPIDRVLALDVATGAVKWSQAGWRLARAMPPGAQVYGTQESTLAVFDPLTGRPERSIQLDDNSVVRVSGDQVLYASSSNRVTAYETSTGRARWAKRLDSVVQTILLREGFLFVVTRGTNILGQEPKAGFIYRLDAATGEGVGDRTHQPDLAASVHEREPSLGDGPPHGRRGGHVGGAAPGLDPQKTQMARMNG